MKTLLRLLFVLLAGCAISMASTTQIWEQRTAEDFEKGEASGISITSDGKLELAPSLDLAYDTGEVYGWGLARDSRGRIFISGGNAGKVFVLPPPSSQTAHGASQSAPAGSLFFKAAEIEAHALAVDAADNLYVGTSPDGKVYKVTSDGKSSVFFEPKTKYIWSLAFDRKGNLWIATGDKGELFRVDQQGKGSVVYKCGDKHIRAVAASGDGVAVGTEGRGRIIRVSENGVAFVLYDAPVREITSLAVAQDGTIYAAGFGTTQRGPQRGPAPLPPPPGLPVTVGGSVSSTIGERVMQLSGETLASGAAAAATQGSEVYRIAPDGYPRRIWKSDKGSALSIALAPDGGVLVGMGERGLVYKVAPDGRAWAVLVRAGASQVTALLADGESRAVYAATGNLGRLYRIDGGFAREGSFQSQVKDAGAFSRWGRLRWRDSLTPGGTVKIYTRSGNTQEPDNTWSPWSEALVQAGGQQVTSPQARFLQWKVSLATADPRATPVVRSVEVAYLPRNVAPEINSIVIHQRDLAIERMPVLQDQQMFPQIISTTQFGSGGATFNPITTMTRTHTSVKKGWQAVTWDAHDDNGDQMSYSVYIKGEGEAEWKLLKDRLEDPFFSWDTTNFPDGPYTVKIVASDSPTNPGDLALQSERVSEPFYIDNTAPVITGLAGSVEGGGRVRVRFHAADSATLLSKAEYSVDGGPLNQVFPVDSVFDSEVKDFDFVIAGLSLGEHTIAVKVADRSNNQSSAKAVVIAK